MTLDYGAKNADVTTDGTVTATFTTEGGQAMQARLYRGQDGRLVSSAAWKVEE